jgi:hypothetical protein
MQRLNMCIVIFLSSLLLIGCATTGDATGEARALRASTSGSQQAGQASARTIAPITSYIGNMPR